MTVWLEVMVVAAPLVSGVWALAVSAPAARRLALGGVGVASLAALANLAHRHVSQDVGFVDRAANPLVLLFISLIGLVAVCMTPRSEGPRTLARVLLVHGAALVSVLFAHPVLVSLAWASQVALLLWELWTRKALRAFRVCAWYLVPSALLMSAATALAGPATGSTAVFVSYALLLAIGVRAGLLPWHAWLPELVERAPLGLVVVFLCPLLWVHDAVLLIAPKANPAAMNELPWGPAGLIALWPRELVNLFAALGFVTAGFGAALGTVQQQARRAFAYVLMSQGALLVFGLGSGWERSAVLGMWLASGLCGAAALMVLGALEARRGPLNLAQPSGNYERTPLLATAFLVASLASVGLPGTLGFVAADRFFGALFEQRPWFTLALIATTGLNAMTLLRCYFYLFMGRSEHHGERDLLRREWAALTLVLGVVVVLGVWPQWGLRWLGF